MKKLMILAAVVCAAIASQAASFNWKTGTGQNVYLMNTTDRAASMTAYLFDASVYTQTAIVDAFAADTFNSLSTLSSVTTASTGAIQTNASGNVFEKNVDSISAFFAIIADDNIFVSTIATIGAADVGAATLSFTGIKTPSQTAATDWQSGMTASAGWYSAVPEPTSGLLMLLGMAGLALRRRRA